MKNDPCWKGYEMVGTKKKGAKTVPNCVPVKETAQSIIDRAKARLAEKRGSDYALYHKSYTDAINHALSHHAKSGLHVSDEDRFHHVGAGPRKPSEGNTNVLTIPATHTSGKKHLLHVQIFNKGGTHPYELNTYSSGMGRSVKEEAEIEEAYGMWKVEFPKQHVGKQVDAGFVHVKAQNTAHAHKVAAKRVGVDHKVFKSKVTKSTTLPEEVEAIDEVSDKTKSSYADKASRFINNNAHSMDPATVKKWNRRQRGMSKLRKEEAEQIDELSKKTLGSYLKKATADDAARPGMPFHDRAKGRGLAARKIHGGKGMVTSARVAANEEVEDIMERGEDDKGYYRSTEDGAGLTRKGAKAMGVKTAVTTPPSKLDPNGKAAKRRKSFCARMGGMKGPMKDEKGRPTRKAMSLRRWNCNEELGKENEWGRPELRKKMAAVTPGQEGMAADTIPMLNPFTGEAVLESTLNEISALGAKKRSQFAAKLQKTLADPKKIAKAKKEIAKKKAAEKAEAPKHLVVQLRKASSIGSKVKFYDGSEHHVAPNHVEKFNDRYHSLKSSIEKESLVKRAHKSHAEFMRAISEETEMGQPEKPCTCAITPANYPTPDQVSPQPEIGDVNNDGMENEWDEAQIEADVTNEIENSSWEDLQKYFDDDDDLAEDYYPRTGFPKEGEYGYHPNPGLKPQESDKDEDMDKAYKIENEKEAQKPLNAAIVEGITPQGRLKKKFAAMRNKTRRNLAKNMALKRIATPDRIKSRSVRAARRMVYKRLLRNRDISTVSSAEKTRLEAQVKRMAATVGRLSVRLQQSERSRDMNRVQNARTRKK